MIREAQRQTELFLRKVRAAWRAPYPALCGIAVCLSRKWRRLDQPTLRRSDRTLGAAQRQGIGAHASGQARSRQIDEPVEKYGYDNIAAALRERGGLPDREQAYLTDNVENIDDFSACQITKKEDWVDLYARPYYFGCEADDRMNATAFGRTNPFGAKLNAIFSSDIGNFDVIDMRHPLPEAWT